MASTYFHMPMKSTEMPVVDLIHLSHCVWYMMLSCEKYDPSPKEPREIQRGTPQLSPQVLIDGLRRRASCSSQPSYPRLQPRSSRECMWLASVPEVD